MSNLENEITAPDGVTTFEHFDRLWTVPVHKQHSHLRRIKQLIRTEGGVDADDIAAIYLSDEEYEALCELDRNEGELNDFANAIAKAMGVGDKGNSQPS
jgi:hypothetical protein